jgi:hypothetical protein
MRTVLVTLYVATAIGCGSADAQPVWGEAATRSGRDAAVGAQPAIWKCVEGYPPTIQGLLDDRAKVLAAASSKVKTPPGAPTSRVNYVITTASKWTPGHHLTVAFLGGSEELRTRVVTAARRWTSLTDDNGRAPNVYLDFGDPPKFREWNTADDDYQAEVRIAFDTADIRMRGYWSAVGSDSVNDSVGFPPGSPSIMLYYFDRQLPPDWDTVIVHEFGHAFGFQHEHQNPENGGCDFRFDDDPGYIETHESNDPKLPLLHDDQNRNPGAYSWFAGPYNHWDRSLVDRNLRQLADSSAFDMSAVDKKSIMKYYFPAVLFKSGEQSPCFTWSENRRISAQDKRGILKAYPPSATDTAKVIQRRVDVLDKVLSDAVHDATVPKDLKDTLTEKRDELKSAK